MVTVDKLLENYRRLEISERDKGAKFERLMKNFLLTNPVYRGKFSDVWLWSEFPFRDELGTVDLGIDIVCKAVDGEFWAVQCKFYAETSTIDKAAVDTFLATSSKTFDGGKKFSVRLWISTSDNLTDNAEITLQNQTPEVLQINLEDLRAAEVDWEKLDAGKFGDEAVTKNFLRDYQSNAIQKAHEHYKHHDRGKLIMACGTGKTFTALKIAEKLFPDGKILFLVPSITLIKQTLVEWARNSDKPFNAICVCSDETVANRNDDEIRNVNLPLPPTTDPEKIFAALNLPRRENFGMTVIFSTYQSLEKVADTKIEFDLIICDEAHRTTGSSKDSATQFTAVHDENFIHGKKRLYMTATPRMYTSDAKTKAAVNDITLWSMDDTEIYGKEFFGLDFGKAVEKNLLSDYKVIVLTVNEKFSAEKKSDDDRAKIDGCINALSKKMIDISQELAEVDPAPMHTAVAFCPKISASKVIAATFNAIAEDKKNLLDVHAEHVDGTQAGSKREKNLRWLKNTPSDGNACRILTNVRCLSEGVDVPALDAVIFMSAKKSRVEIVQAVGRVMRKAQNKKYGYIIIPVVVPLEKNPEDVLSTSKTYDVIWEILNALRAHDKRVDIFIEEIKLNKKNDHIKITRTIGDDEDSIQIPLNFGEWQDFLYARMVERVGNRRYWEQWAKDIAEIAERHIQHIKQLIENNPDFKSAFNVFIQNLNANLNSDAGTDKAVEMLAHHLISRPVFDAIFENYSFVKNNPVSQSLEEILSALDTQYTPEDSAQLEKFYNSVRERCAIATSAEDKQKVIIELYDKFFRMAVPKIVERLGIVYTPVEVVDFILRSVDAVLKKNFNRRLTDKNVHVLDPFAGTGTFLVRLIQSGLIRTQDLQRKYFRELHANELVLLAYYIAAVNIENAFHGVAGEDYRQFPGICLTDTFQAFEQDENSKGQIVDKTFRDPLEINSARVKNQLNTRIEIIVGNPPYSVGQKSANDNNQNTFYPKIEARIAATYAAKTSATNKNALYDSYIKAFRWASDRISEGIIGFVTNAGWLDGTAMDGLRKCFAEEFAEIYVFNLRGNARTQGEQRQREKGNVFGSGSRAPIAITILVKAPHDGSAKIFYRDIGDYLSRDEKLLRLQQTPNVLHEDFQPLTPNERGDWINQRGDLFDSFIALAPDKKFDGEAESFFVTYSSGVQTNRDAWCYNFSRDALEKNIRTTIDFYNTHEPTDVDPTKINWTRGTKKNKTRGHEYIFNAAQIVEAVYRPFCKQNLYYDRALIEMVLNMPKFFPTGNEENLLICVNGVGDKDFSVMITNKTTDEQIQFNGQCFPLYYYERSREIDLFGDNYEQRDGVSDFILNRAKLLYGGDVSKEDVFYYVYGFLHLPSYREKFSAELKKSLPRIILTPDAKKFWQLSRAGRALAEIHLNYESQEPPAEVQLEIRNEELGIKIFRVKKLKLVDERRTLIYNDFIAIKNIPPRSFDYVVNGRSPLEWIIDRYQVKTDSASGIVNDANAWCIEHDNPRYILDLILSCITVSLRTLDIVDSLPAVEF